jgi:hypothetical protein
MKNATHLSAMLSMVSVQLVLHLTQTSILRRAIVVSNASKRQQLPITTETESLHNRLCSRKKDGFVYNQTGVHTSLFKITNSLKILP